MRLNVSLLSAMQKSRYARGSPRSDASQLLSGSSFGNEMRASFRMPEAPFIEVRDLSFGPLTATELRCDEVNYGRSAPIPHQDALLVSLQLRPNHQHEVWEDGRPLPLIAVSQGTTCIFDLRRGVNAHSMEPFHCLNFAVPLHALDEAGEERLSIDALARDVRQGLPDPVIQALGTSLLPSLAEPQRANRLFVDHVLFAVRAHVAQRLAAIPSVKQTPGGLAPWQERRAKAMIEAHLTENLSLAELAHECELSVAQFARAFKRSTGRPPHRFMLERRLDRAKQLLPKIELPLADIAISCGFADQSHFTKVFRRILGTSPGQFRAAMQSRQMTRR